jgi:hypothetical protein
VESAWAQEGREERVQDTQIMMLRFHYEIRAT